MKNYTDKEIQKIFKTTSSSISGSRDHFRKIVASLDMETAHSTPKVLPRIIIPSPFVFFQSRFVQVAGSAFVFMFALLGIYSSSSAPTKNTAAEVVTQNTSTADDTQVYSMATNNYFQDSTSSSNPAGAVYVKSLSKNVGSVETTAIASALSTELSAEQDASDDLFALNGI